MLGAMDDLTGLSLLVIDDEEANLTVLRSILSRAGYRRVETLQDPRRAADVVRRMEPDLILLDYQMPGLDGLQVLREIAPALPEYLPVLMLTAHEHDDLRERALASGVRDFVAKPVSGAELLLRIRNLLEARSFHRRLQQQNAQLEGLVTERTRELERAHVEALARLALAAEFRDDQVGAHVWRVARGAELVAQRLGCDPAWRQLLVRAARLHDVGKIAIPDGILFKPGRLTPEEFALVRTHPEVGHRLLSGGASELLRMAASIALTHHERWDGTGYPSGLAGEAIPLEGRIVAAVDAFDGMTRDRTHQRAATPAEAMAELEANAGGQFDADVVAAMRAAFDDGELPVPDPPT
jgi:putative two-component system response regulator